MLFAFLRACPGFLVIRFKIWGPLRILELRFWGEFLRGPSLARCCSSGSMAFLTWVGVLHDTLNPETLNPKFKP